MSGLKPIKTLKESWPGLRRVVLRFWPAICQHRALLIGSILMLFVGVGLRLLEPWPLKIVFDRVIRVKPREGLAGISFVDGLDPATLLLLAALAVVLIATLRALTNYAYTVGFALLSNRVLSRVREDV